jgi:hypothetical protein
MSRRQVLPELYEYFSESKKELLRQQSSRDKANDPMHVARCRAAMPRPNLFLSFCIVENESHYRK